MAPVIKFKNVCFSYGKREILHNINFSVEPNTFVGIVGPNAGGKTTLLKLALGLISPDHGSIEIFGTTPKKARKKIGYVMQHLAFDPQFPVTIQDVVLMGRSGKIKFGRYTKNDKMIAEKSLEQTGIILDKSLLFSELSGGQQQRVLIAQALASEPQLILLDEPTANIDTEGERAIHNLLTDLSKEITVVSVSHNVNIVMDTVTHVLCVNTTADMKPIKKLNPGIIANANGNELAVLHHEMNCHVIDSTFSRSTPHFDPENTNKKNTGLRK